MGRRVGPASKAAASSRTSLLLRMMAGDYRCASRAAPDPLWVRPRTPIRRGRALVFAGFKTQSRGKGAGFSAGRAEMESVDVEEQSSCSDCGVPVAPLGERLYAFGTDGLLCMECALRRGGAWDEGRER